MKHSDAAAVLGLSGAITPETVHAAWLAMAKKYHPDVNPAGAEMMKVINAARDALDGFAGTIDAGEAAGYGDALAAALAAIIGLPGLSIEICGAWAWISGNTRVHREALKAAGCRWAPAKQLWYYRPAGWRACKRGAECSMDDIRAKYGSARPYAGNRRAAIAPGHRDFAAT
jgi:hypothetical protein